MGDSDLPAHNTGLAALIGEMRDHAVAMASFSSRADAFLEKTRKGREAIWDLQTRITALQWQPVESPAEHLICNESAALRSYNTAWILTVARCVAIP